MKLFAFFLLLIVLSYSERNGDIVNGLENITKYTKTWYSGLLNISSNSSTLNVHYFFFPSQNSPTTDPVLLWLNGGPGCSSLLGSSQENGPWVF